MGDEARCRLRYGDELFEGRAVLESDELVFRGDFRRAFALRDVRSATVRDGALVLELPGETATFELGPKAERWAERIRNPRTLLEKLGLRPGLRISLVGIEDGAFRRLLLRQGVEFSEAARNDSDVIVLGAERAGDLERLARLRASLKRDGAIWVVAPKGGREPREADVLAAGKAAGLVDTKVARFSDTHTAHKFVIPVAGR